MELDTLEALYIDELKDLWSAEKQILRALPKMIKAVSHRDLKRAFATHERQTKQHVRRLERICKELGVSPRGKKCEGTVRTWARLLGREDQANVLQETLDEEGETDHLLTDLAERLINVAAAE